MARAESTNTAMLGEGDALRLVAEDFDHFRFHGGEMMCISSVSSRFLSLLGVNHSSIRLPFIASVWMSVNVG